MSQKIRINNEIWSREVRLIDENGTQLGIMSRDEALAIAKSKDLDLAEVGPQSRPVVCRIINFDKFRYQQAKKEKQQRLASKKVTLKGIRLGIRTGAHDLEVKKQKALKFLKSGKKVRIELVLKGRERAHKDLGYKVLNDFIENLQEEEQVKLEQPVMSSPKGFNCIVTK